MDVEKDSKYFEALAKLPENNPGPVFQLSLDGKILLANKAARRLFSKEVLTGVHFLELIPELGEKFFHNSFANEINLKFETVVGECNFIFTFVRPADEEIIFAYGNDVTEVRKAQQQIAEQAEKLQEMARFPEMNPGPVFRINLAGKILLANRASRRVFGENIIGDNWLKVFPGMNEKKWESILASKEILYLELHLNNCDYVFAHLHDIPTELVFVYGSDVSIQKKAERALRNSEKLATLGTLAAGVAHELNNPAAATKRASEQLRLLFQNLEQSHVALKNISYSEQLKELTGEIESIVEEKSGKVNEMNSVVRMDKEGELEEWLDEWEVESGWELAPSLVALELKKDFLIKLKNETNADSFRAILKWATEVFQVNSLLNEIYQGSGRISEIITALKNYSFLGQAPVQSVNIHEGIDNTLVILRNKMKSGINVVREYDSNIPPIMAFGSELNQAWTNILDNAADAMSGKGNILIRTYLKNESVFVEIQDDGPGIPAEIKDRIFDPFYTTKEPGKGTGLGLSTTYSIITEKHKGEIKVDSVPGKTIFTVKLPLK